MSDNIRIYDNLDTPLKSGNKLIAKLVSGCVEEGAEIYEWHLKFKVQKDGKCVLSVKHHKPEHSSSRNPKVRNIYGITTHTMVENEQDAREKAKAACRAIKQSIIENRRFKEE